MRDFPRLGVLSRGFHRGCIGLYKEILGIDKDAGSPKSGVPSWGPYNHDVFLLGWKLPLSCCQRRGLLCAKAGG